MRAASFVRSLSGIKVCSMTEAVRGNAVTINHPSNSLSGRDERTMGTGGAAYPCGEVRWSSTRNRMFLPGVAQHYLELKLRMMPFPVMSPSPRPAWRRCPDAGAGLLPVLD
jgi:hypothetical protein